MQTLKANPPIVTLSNGQQAGRNQSATSQPNFDHSALPSIVQLQRKLLAFFYIYATIIVTLYLTYAIYCYYQHTSNQPVLVSNQAGAPSAGQQQQVEQALARSSSGAEHTQSTTTAEQLEQKLHLLERYIEMVALDLEDTRARLRERERCACSLRCTFNGTTFQDGQSWQQKCDTCTCSGGKISCSPRKCPKLNCAIAVQLPGQCCPSCMKSCKLNKTTVKHGETIQTGPAQSQKQCKCNDGLIKCEPTTNASKKAIKQQTQNKTMEYLKSIIAGPQLLKLRSS